MSDERPDPDDPSGHDVGEHDADPDTYRATFDSASVRPTDAVVEALAAALETSPIDLDPLYDVVDPDALDLLFVTSRTDNRVGERTLAFTYQGYRVTVKSCGLVEVGPLTAREGEEE